MSEAQRVAIVRILRELRPALLILPWPEVRHPDHLHASRLGEEAFFRAGLFKLETPEPPFRPGRILYYMERIPFEPTLVVDVSHDHPRMLEAVRAYRSQFEARAGDGEPATFLTRPDFLVGVEARARHYGARAGFRFGEPFRTRGPLPVGDPALLIPEVWP
jgi:LmbE family N-acetylglucosaminyl deacetylase